MRVRRTTVFVVFLFVIIRFLLPICHSLPVASRSESVSCFSPLSFFCSRTPRNMQDINVGAEGESCEKNRPSDFRDIRKSLSLPVTNSKKSSYDVIDKSNPGHPLSPSCRMRQRVRFVSHRVPPDLCRLDSRRHRCIGDSEQDGKMSVSPDKACRLLVSDSFACPSVRG